MNNFGSAVKAAQDYSSNQVGAAITPCPLAPQANGSTVVFPKELNEANFKDFVQELRTVWRAHQNSKEEILVTCGTNSFRFRNSDLYLIATRSGSTAQFQKLKKENYDAMSGKENKVSLNSIKNAMNAAFSGNFDVYSQHLLQVILVTAESARSHTVKRIVTRTIKHEISPKWSELAPLLIRLG